MVDINCYIGFKHKDCIGRFKVHISEHSKNWLICQTIRVLICKRQLKRNIKFKTRAQQTKKNWSNII